MRLLWAGIIVGIIAGFAVGGSVGLHVGVWQTAFLKMEQDAKKWERLAEDKCSPAALGKTITLHNAVAYHNTEERP